MELAMGSEYGYKPETMVKHSPTGVRRPWICSQEVLSLVTFFFFFYLLKTFFSINLKINKFLFLSKSLLKKKNSKFIKNIKVFFFFHTFLQNNTPFILSGGKSPKISNLSANISTIVIINNHII